MSDELGEETVEPSLVIPERGRDGKLADSISDQQAFDLGVHKRPAPGLADKLLAPCFTVLDTRAGYWQKRRRDWLSLGIRGETIAESGSSFGGTGTEGRHPDDLFRHGVNAGKDYGFAGGSGNSAQPTGAYRRAGGEQVGKVFKEEPEGNLKDGSAGLSNQQQRRSAFNQPSIDTNRPEGEDVGGRAQGLIYQHDAPGSDPGFYTKKTALEKQLGRELTTEEFKRDYYRREEQDFGESQSVQTGTSVFDPMLCEIAYRWFSNEDHHVVDPFAGGAVRGVVAGALRRRYSGIELRPEQLRDNREQAWKIFGPESTHSFGREPHMPEWIEGDATQLRKLELEPADFIFTCPPYADLEVYSSDPADLSNMGYPLFRAMLASAMAQSAELLKENRFAVWVLGEAREGKGRGAEYGLIADTIRAARDAGLALYNSAILLNSVGSAALRAQMILRSRKLTRVHQHVLVFVKGDHLAAAADCETAGLEW